MFPCPFRRLPGLLVPPGPDRGSTTAEYALCIIAAIAFAGVLYAVLKSSAVNDALTAIVVDALSSGR
ncbi:DUF4244 domain-containing protein [Nocardiopsis algeriensis]|uniref:DUF4244 domain-containing protein n=1 Tax=Nocardiopsis algeriensis TaxID=1478215 RepID=A0A841J166_9ACTN|nr:DUF4244 domain-containing protein [Nocardiopsis algeriensis]MBB6122081.1 hypothetical protein [Nocardiopsis algeriensis]